MTPSRPLSLAERLDWLRLIRSENVGPITFRRLLERDGTAAAALDALPALARQGGRVSPLRLYSKAAAKQEIGAAEALGARLLCWGDPDYPQLLFHIDDAPPCLYAAGCTHLLQSPCIAVVGARNASLAATRFTESLASELGKAGLIVASGLARGIDSAAHRAALDTGTVAVIAGGPGVYYPPENRPLQDEISARGVVLSEMPPYTEPLARYFPRRNRIISGVSLGVVVVEASARSGTLITARMAAEQGRDVFAVPGSPVDPRCAGPNALLKDGAILTRDAKDVLDALQDRLRRPLGEPATTFDAKPLPPPPCSEDDLAKARQTVLSALSVAPTSVDDLLHQSRLPPAVVQSVLLELELAGRLDRVPGNQVSLLPAPDGP